MTLPALSDNRLLRLLAFGGLYAAQGIPYGMFVVALPSWLAANGYSSGQVGIFIAAVTLPWTLKLVAGPIMDRFSFLPMGRRRPWVLLAQSGILLGCLVLSSGMMEFYWILGVGFFINFCAAWQDVAVDGMAIDVLEEEERARANAFMFGGQVIGISASSAIGAMLLADFGLGVAGIVISISVLLIALIPLLLRERPGERLMPWTSGDALERSLELQETNWARIFGDLFRVLILPMSILLIVIKFGDRVVNGVLTAALPVLTTQELSLAQTFYPEWSALGGIIGAFVGVAVSPFIDRITAQRALFAGLAIKAMVLAGFAMLEPYWGDRTLIIGLILAVALMTQWLTIATISLFMNLCASKVSASQFAVYMAMSNLALSAGSGMLGPLDAMFTYQQLFYLAAGAEVLMLGLLFMFSLERHKARLSELFPAPVN